MDIKIDIKHSKNILIAIFILTFRIIRELFKYYFIY